MHFSDRRFPVLLLTLLLLPAVYLFFEHGRDAADARERRAFLGTWTDAQGPAGNSIRFYQVARPIPGTFPGVEALEGHAVFHDLLGPGDVHVTWNFESFRPLRLNVVFPKRVTVVPVKILDDDHILIRIVDTARVDIWTNANVFDAPDVIRLTRMIEAP